jgi:hypothetical protein
VTGPGDLPGPSTAAPASVGARVLSWDGRAGMLEVGGRTLPFTLLQVVGFHPAPGLDAVAELGADGSLHRLTLPGHPERAEPEPHRPFGWITMLRPTRLGPELAAWRSALAPVLGTEMRLSVRVMPDGATLVEVRRPGAQMLVLERDGVDTARMERRLLSANGSLPTVGWELLPAPVLPGEERRLLGAEAPDPWGEQGSSRRAVRLVLAALDAGGTHVVLEQAGRLALRADEARARLGDPEDGLARPFGAFLDWALTPGRTRYRTLGMAVAGGEDVEIAITHPHSEVELDSAESALLFACHLQVRGGRLLDDGEVFYVPKDVRIGPRGATAVARTGYKYQVLRGDARQEHSPGLGPVGVSRPRLQLVRG